MFLSTTTNNLDAKGRVSVPSDFRAVVGDGNFDGIIVWPSFDGPYLEGGGIALIEDYARSLKTMDYYDEARDNLQRAIFAESRRLSFDSGGRVTLPKDLAEYANLSGSATFVGLGEKFEIWNTQDHEAKRAEVRAKAREYRNRLVSLEKAGA
ncbi:MAG: division/cell wall cluster transcriptional repressor MraZ [Hyphomonadaceae bacterium]|nr:division/cell wall cluster transcriptional repressor MraZ [Hyphomonadaceae bacterium]MBC6412004.1 division/cell wall cluster transcriptional repressor MraZ [Hyphomonadaceae bacterium]